MEIETSTVECKESPDGKHCWHATTDYSIVHIPGGSNKFNEICCWCGEAKEYVVEVPFSYSTSTTPHGPHYQTRMYYSTLEMNR